MKTLNSILVLLIFNSTLYGQHLLTNPNKSIKGLREGLWSEIDLCRIIDSTGEYYVVFREHFTPTNIIAEGLYIKGERQGFWKEYWIDFLGDTEQRYRKGRLKSVIEYANGVRCGPLIEYHTNGSLRAVGQYETYPANDTVKIDVPDWTKDPDGSKGIMKDTTIYIRARSRPVGTWQFFKPDGTIWK